MGGTYWLRGGGAQSLPLEGRQRRQRTVPTPRVRGLFDSTVAQIEAEKMHARLYFGTAPLFAFFGGGTSTKTRSRKRLPPKVEKSAKLPPKVEFPLSFSIIHEKLSKKRAIALLESTRSGLYRGVNL